jgi:hypothetical protein
MRQNKKRERHFRFRLNRRRSKCAVAEAEHKNPERLVCFVDLADKKKTF